jgi:hypothetical protein
MITGSPIVPHARWLIRCACGFAHDSVEGETAPEAIRAFLTEHQHACGLPSFTAEPYPTKEA